ncbi:dihydrofolate reductase [Amycolatopsis bartoniae]|uniref:Deaminase reductase n=1 Tax=Amycolatopsis bartoniae TaxID=941986 RepID=A0A8H9IPV2_9PSEU|nr:dihydrofolate reductase family protein [Amycolatopsis bartoniae]MBB2934707.1 dihydrofolate reductase [Amycolatopsis bartoniae]TVT09357.1 dihydrofolate reductase [Amycolatopsis bartoniae]GHF45352.1 deaminase reductase [Amycolatopsis bartoniae]
MGKVFCDVSVSVNGYLAGPAQSRENPLGEGGELLHRWQFERADENRAEIEAICDAGAFIMGRNMFGPIRGEWDSEWQGWWGDEPPYHGPVFVLTHHPRESIEMKGGTTFHFVTDGIESALRQAREAAGDRDISIAGGASTINQYLAAGLLDEVRLHVAPVVLDGGERLFEGLPSRELELVSARPTSLVTHVSYRVRG